MKRGADKQLSKDDNPDDEVEVCRLSRTLVEFVLACYLDRKSKQVSKSPGTQSWQGGSAFFRCSSERLFTPELSDYSCRIRSLPKRRSPAVAPVSPPGATVRPNSSLPPTSIPLTSKQYYQQPAVPQKFGSFSGFGGGTTPLTLASPLVGPPHKPADAPAVSESASNATKKFASFLGPSTAGTKPAVPLFETPKQAVSDDADEVALKYYTSLRGLNSSFLSAISKAIESDPFMDIADLLEQYKNHRVSVQQDYDGKSSHTRTQSAPSPPSKPSVPAAQISFLKPPSSAPATMPVPPSSFSSFGPFPSSSAPATGFTPSSAAPTADPSPFNLSSVVATSSDPKPVSAASSSPFSGFGSVSSLSPFKPATSHTSKEADSTFTLNPPSFGAFASTGTSSAFSLGNSGSGGTSLPGTSTLLFGNPPKSSTLFGSDKVTPEEKDKEKDKPASPPGPFGFSLAPGTKLFGDTSTSFSGSSNIFSASTMTKSADEKDKEKDKATAAAAPSSAFGTPFGVPSKTSPFTFGSAASAATPAQFGFGVAPGVGKGSPPPPPKAGSVGFSFGSPSRTSPSQATTSTTTSTAAPGSIFSFGSTTSTSASGAGGTAGTAESTPASTNASTPAPASAVPALLDQPSSAASRGDTPATEGSLEEDGLARTQSPGLQGGEGEGEEDEDTTYMIKAKVFKFTTDREGAPTWSDMGIGAYLPPSLRFVISLGAHSFRLLCIGLLRLKKHKETNARRVILRSSTTGKIIIVRWHSITLGIVLTWIS